MSGCALCMDPDAAGLARVSGVDLCVVCRSTDPAGRLQEHGIAASWEPGRLGFAAGLALPRQVSDFRLHCVPRRPPGTTYVAVAAGSRRAGPAPTVTAQVSRRRKHANCDTLILNGVPPYSV